MSHAAILICLLLAMWLPIPTSAETVVLVAQEEKSSQAVKAIIQGIKSSISPVTIAAIEGIADIDETVLRSKYPVIIIGSKLIGQTHLLPPHVRAIGGGFYKLEDNSTKIPAISLYPSIETVSSEVKKTGFKLSRLITVTPSPVLGRKLEAYKAGLHSTNVELEVTTISGERATARAWFETLRDINPATDALIITDDKFLESSGAYKEIIEAAWKRDILVVSVLPNYARRGVALGFIPDLFAYGALLAETAHSSQLMTGLNAREQPADVGTDIHIRVFNQRTIEHIGYALPSDIDNLTRDDLVIR